MLNRLIPILHVARIEESLPFWVERLGFEISAQEELDGTLTFVMLKQGELVIELMSLSQRLRDLPELVNTPVGTSTLYFPVDSLDLIADRLDDYPLVIDVRIAPYGMREVIVREPSGHIIFFAQPV